MMQNNNENEIYIPVKNKELLEKHNVFVPSSTLYKWSMQGTYPGLFSKIKGRRDLFLRLSKYIALFENQKFDERNVVNYGKFGQ